MMFRDTAIFETSKNQLKLFCIEITSPHTSHKTKEESYDT